MIVEDVATYVDAWKSAPSRTLHNEKGQYVCGSLKAHGGLCERTQIHANGRCRSHNGGAKSGIAHPRYTTGKYALSMPTRLLERYRQAVTDPDYLNMQHEMALMQSR